MSRCYVDFIKKLKEVTWAYIEEGQITHTKTMQGFRYRALKERQKNVVFRIISRRLF